MKFGLVGLPNSGKTTLFNILTNNSALVEVYPFSTIEPNVGITLVKDERLNKIWEYTKTKKIENVSLEVVDVAGLVKGASEGVGMGNKFLSHIRGCNLIVEVIRCFIDEKIPHFYTTVDSCRDFEILNMELALSDLEILERKLGTYKGKLKINDDIKKEEILVKKLIDKLSSGDTLFSNDFSSKETNFSKSLNLLSEKPMVCVANLGDNNDDKIQELENICSRARIGFFKFYVKYEEDMKDMSEGEKIQLREEFQLDNSDLNWLLKEVFKRLNLITFFTFNERETKAWCIEEGSSAREAAGKIHTDIMEGFIKAEVISCEDFISNGGWNLCKNKGLIRIEGSDYKVKDGDIIYIKFR